MKSCESLRWAVMPVVLVAALVLVSCGSSSIPTATELAMVSSPAPSVGGVKGQVYEGINRFRQSRGKPVFRRDGDLEKLAQDHAEQMLRTKKMSHDGYHLRQGAAEAYYGIGMLRENVFWSYGRPRSTVAGAMVEGWATSPGHRRNLLANSSLCGVGVASDADGNVYSAQLSGAKINRSGL